MDHCTEEFDGDHQHESQNHVNHNSEKCTESRLHWSARRLNCIPLNAPGCHFGGTDQQAFVREPVGFAFVNADEAANRHAVRSFCPSLAGIRRALDAFPLLRINPRMLVEDTRPSDLSNSASLNSLFQVLPPSLLNITCPPDSCSAAKMVFTASADQSTAA